MSIKLAKKTAAAIEVIRENTPEGEWAALPIKITPGTFFPVKYDGDESYKRVTNRLDKLMEQLTPRKLYGWKVKLIWGDDGKLQGEVYSADLFKLPNGQAMIVMIIQ